MIHLRIVAPEACSERVLELLKSSRSVTNVVFLKGAAHDPVGDLVMADVAREDATVVLSDLREMDLDRIGSIAIEEVDAQISERADAAIEHAAGSPSDAVVWEEVQARTSETTELSAVFLIFMVLAALIAAAGIYLDSPILVVGAMVVGPEFGPIAGFCVAAVQLRRDVAIKSFVALIVGFPLAIGVVYLATLIFKATGITPETFSEKDHSLSSSISNPDFFAFFVAACAGAAGMLSLSTAKSGALIGVLISVTTIPTAANIGIGLAYGDAGAWQGSLTQLAINLAAILLSGTTTLGVQRAAYRRRRRRHLLESDTRQAAGLPIGHSLRGTHSAIDVRALRGQHGRDEDS